MLAALLRRLRFGGAAAVGAAAAVVGGAGGAEDGGVGSRPRLRLWAPFTCTMTPGRSGHLWRWPPPLPLDGGEVGDVAGDGLVAVGGEGDAGAVLTSPSGLG